MSNIRLAWIHIKHYIAESLSVQGNFECSGRAEYLANNNRLIIFGENKYLFILQNGEQCSE